MQEEWRNLVKVWIVFVPATLAYCRSLSSFIKPGNGRLLAILPAVALFFLLPLSFSTVHLRFMTAGFLCWLASFRLLLFAFDLGPLRGGPHHPLLEFIVLTSFPIIIKRNSRPTGPRGRGFIDIGVFAVKMLLLSVVISVYSQTDRLRREFVLFLYSVHIYLEADALLTVIAVVARVILPSGADLGPQFAAPYLSFSLQEFWGRRWNIAISSLLRESVYCPVRLAYGRTSGVLASFAVSGLMHEILWIYATLKPPTGEVTTFFVLHGLCTVTEEVVKRWWLWRGFPALPAALTAPLTVGFVIVTSWWLFLPPLERSQTPEHIIAEAEMFLRLFRGGWEMK